MATKKNKETLVIEDDVELTLEKPVIEEVLPEDKPNTWYFTEVEYNVLKNSKDIRIQNYIFYLESGIPISGYRKEEFIDYLISNGYLNSNRKKDIM